MKSYLGTYNISSAEPGEVTVLIFDKEVHIGYRNQQGQNTQLKWAMLDVDASFDFSKHTTRIRHARETGVEIFVNGNDAANYIKEMQSEQSKPWYKKDKAKEWRRNLLIFFGVAGFLVLLYFLLVPWMSEKLATRVSIKTEEQFGEAVYEALVPQNQDNVEASLVVNDFFAAMNVRTAYNVRITVMDGETVNAFALPGGRIVVYSALLEKMESYPELAALISHEFTHVNNKHSTKSIFRKLGSKIFISLLFGKFGSVTSVLVDQADNLKSLKYSRGLEKEADVEGLALLQDRKIDPKGFADLFKHLKESAPAGSMPEFLGSHPDIDKRITYIREASTNAVVVENEQLKAIFKKLKQNVQQ